MTHAVEARHLHQAYADTFAAGAAPQNVVGADALENRRALSRSSSPSQLRRMDRLHEQIRGSGYALVLTDAHGAVLYEKQDASLVNKPLERMRSGVAIRGVGREVIAVLDAACVGSTATRASHLHMMALISACAHLIEKCLFLRHHQQHVVLRFHARSELVNLLHDGALALAPDGTVIGADRAAEELRAPIIAISSSADRLPTSSTPRARTSWHAHSPDARPFGRCANCVAEIVITSACTAARARPRKRRRP